MYRQQSQRASARALSVNYCDIVSQVERGFSHAMIYTSKIIDLDEERAAGGTGFAQQQHRDLTASRRPNDIRQHGASGTGAGR